MRISESHQGAGQFATANTILRIGDAPHGDEPLFQTERAFFKDRSDLGRELASRMLLMALPTALILEVRNSGRSTMGTADTFGPTHLGKVSVAKSASEKNRTASTNVFGYVVSAFMPEL